MKNSMTRIIICALLGLPMISNAQFLTNPPFNNYIRTDFPATMQKIGIGNFPTNASVEAKLHLSRFLLASDAATDGLLFRTDGDNSAANNWSMFTGGSSGTVTEKFRLSVPANSNAVDLRTVQNGHLNLFTNSIHRLKLNPNVSYNVNGYAGDRDGYLLLGNSSGSSTSLFTNDTLGAFSLLHLNGPLGGFSQQRGYRPWMQTGITYTDNGDMSYMGLRAVGSRNNLTETVIGWANDQSSGYGPDDLCFRFFGGSGADNTISSNKIATGDLDGKHIARFTSGGNIGFGPTFGVDDPMYVAPQSLLHLSRDLSKETWLQITNENGTRQAVNDGLRVGIVSDGTAYVRQHENLPVIFQTDWDNTAGGIANGERMRITSIGAPGAPRPAGASSNNITRVAISHDGSNPITEPRSLLHLGYNVGQPLPSNDGWRDWMDVGMFVNNGSDNIYLGLKNEGGVLTDQYDAVINWGDNQDSLGSLGVGPDNLRFIFTSTVDIGAGDPVSTSNNGLEVARMEPGRASTLASGGYDYGMMGIGNFSPGSPNDVGGTPVDAKLDIDGDLRIREVTRVDTLNAVLVIDTNDLNRVHWRPISGLGGGVGNYCSEPQDTLSGHYEVPLNDYNYYFTGSQPFSGSGSNTNGIAIGMSCGTDLLAKLHVVQDQANYADPLPISITAAFENSDTSAFTGYGAIAISRGEKLNMNIGGHFYGRGAAKDNIGVQGIARGTNLQGETPTNYGGKFEASQGAVNYGIYAEAGGDSVGGPDFAGYFEGDVNTTGGYYTVSDQNLKEHVEPIQSASQLLSQLNPVGYDFRYQQYNRMNLPRGHQFGLIAQELEQVIPEIVGDIVHPAAFDTLGNEIAPQIELKGVNYTQLIPLLIAGFKEQQADMAAKDEVINTLAERLTILENYIEASRLCETGDATNKMNNGDTNGETITLENHNAII